MKKMLALLSALLVVQVAFAAQTCNKADFLCFESGPSQNLSTPFRVDSAGNTSTAGTLSVTGATTLTGATSITGAASVTGASTLTGGATVGSYLTFSSSAPVITAAGQQIVPIGSYVLLNPSNLAGNTAMTAAPTISTTTPSGANIPDGTFLVVSSTSPLPVKLQDVGTLAGSGLFLGSATGGPTGGVPQSYVLVSSTMTQTFILNASTGAWILTSR